MSATEDFERAVRFCVSDLYGTGSKRMRSEAVEAVEGGIAALGLEPVVQAYLRATFGVDGLADLGDEQLGRAMLFIAQLERQVPPKRVDFPWSGGGSMEGEFVWFRGRVGAAG